MFFEGENQERQDQYLEISDDCLCPITQMLMVNPVVTADGHTYEEASIREWIQLQQQRGQAPTSPNTGASLANTELTPNHALRNVIEELRQRMPNIQQQMIQKERKTLDLRTLVSTRERELAAQQQSIERLTQEVRMLYQQKVHKYTLRLEQDPRNIKYLERRGETYLSLQEPAKAYVDFNTWVGIDPNSDLALTYRGRALLAMGRNEEALTDLNRSLELAPGYADTLTFRGLAYMKLGRVDDAARDFRQVLTIDRQNEIAHKQLGIIEQQQAGNALQP